VNAAQLALMADLFPGATDVKLEWRPREYKAHKCSECGQDHVVLEPGGNYINGHRVSREIMAKANEDLTKIIALGDAP